MDARMEKIKERRTETLGASGGQTELKEWAPSSDVTGGKVLGNLLGLSFQADGLWLSEAASSNPLLPPQMPARCQRRGKNRRQVLSFLTK